MTTGRKKKKKAATRYRKITMKLTDKQKKLVDHFARARKTTANKLIKKALKEYLLRHAASLPDTDYISENQLSLFEEDEFNPPYTQGTVENQC